MTIGRDPSSDIQIDSLAVEPLHARISGHNNKFTIQHVGGAEGTFVNHKKIDECELKHKDIVRVGKHTLQFAHEEILPDEALLTHSRPVADMDLAPASLPAAPAAAKPAAFSEDAGGGQGWLQIMSGKYLGKTVKLKPGLTDLRKISTVPTVVARRNNGYHLSNLGEPDQVSVGGSKVGDESRLLHDGDVIKIGDMSLQFYIQAE